MAGTGSHGDTGGDTNGTAQTHWGDDLEQTTGPMASGTPEENAPATPPPGTPGEGGTTATSEDGDGTTMTTTAPEQGR